MAASVELPAVPKEIVLWPGLRVTMRYRSPRWFKRHGYSDSEGFSGTESCDHYAITLRRGLPLDRQWWVIVHEMKHAFVDWDNYMLRTVIEPLWEERLKREGESNG